MNTEIPILQICIHKLDRSISSFVQNDGETAKRILQGFDPIKIFSRPRIVIGDRNSHTVIPVPQITRIDFEINPDSALSFLTDLVEAVELMPPEFAALVQSRAVNNPQETDEFAVTFLNLEMADARNVLLTMDPNSASPRETGGLRDFLLSRSELCFRASSGGVSALNLANLASLTILPGVNPPQDDTWPAARCGEKLLAKAEETLTY